MKLTYIILPLLCISTVMAAQDSIKIHNHALLMFSSVI